MAGRAEVVVTLSHESRTWIAAQQREAIREIKALLPTGRRGGLELEPDALEPITIQAPDGERVMFIDPETNEGHWPLTASAELARRQGWRQCFTVAGR